MGYCIKYTLYHFSYLICVSAQRLHMAAGQDTKHATLQCRRRVLEQKGTNICFGAQIDSKKKSETICGF